VTQHDRVDRGPELIPKALGSEDPHVAQGLWAADFPEVVGSQMTPEQAERKADLAAPGWERISLSELASNPLAPIKLRRDIDQERLALRGGPTAQPRVLIVEAAATSEAAEEIADDFFKKLGQAPVPTARLHRGDFALVLPGQMEDAASVGLLEAAVAAAGGKRDPTLPVKLGNFEAPPIPQTLPLDAETRRAIETYQESMRLSGGAV